MNYENNAKKMFKKKPKQCLLLNPTMLVTTPLLGEGERALPQAWPL